MSENSNCCCDGSESQDPNCCSPKKSNGILGKLLFFVVLIVAALLIVYKVYVKESAPVTGCDTLTAGGSCCPSVQVANTPSCCAGGSSSCVSIADSVKND